LIHSIIQMDLLDWNCQCEENCLQKYADGHVGIVINVKHGGFGLSDEAIAFMGDVYTNDWSISRTHPRLVKAVCQLGNKVNRRYAELKIEWIEKKYQNYFQITEYDGYEILIVNHDLYLMDKVRTILKETDDTKLLLLIKQFRSEEDWLISATL
jgi:hypothetical protein